LDVEFDLQGQTIPASEIVNLGSTYWFVKDLGLVKIHWQGGTIQHRAEFGDESVNQQSPVPGLSEEQLAIVCITLPGQTTKCSQIAGISQSDLTPPPASELELQAFVFPDLASLQESLAPTGVAVTPATVTPGGQQATTPGATDEGGAAFLEYAAAVESLAQRLSVAAQEFWEAALKYQAGQLTRDEFQSEFEEFAQEVRGLIEQINRLSPPPEARSIHQKLTGGLTKCDQAISLMDDWFDAPDSDKQEAAALLVAECVEDVTAAVDELMQP